MNRKIVLIGGLIVFFVGLVLFVYFRYFRNKVTAFSKKNRRIKFEKKTSSSFSGTSDFTGTEIAGSGDKYIEVPALVESFYSDTGATQMKVKMSTIETKYGSYINNIAKLTNVSPILIKSFIYVESSGDETAKTYCCYGLMQIAPESASLSLWYENKYGRLSSGEDAIIKKYVPNINYNNSKTAVSSADLYKPELNILIGSIMLGQLIDNDEGYEKVISVKAAGNTFDEKGWHVKDDVTKRKYINLDFVIAQYNRGAGITLPSEKIKSTDKASDVVSARCSKLVSCDYIKKIWGTNGTLDVLIG